MKSPIFIIPVISLVLLITAVRTYPQTTPYIDGEVVSYGLDPIHSYSATDTLSVQLQLLCSFKIANPDTVPFYLWIALERGGVMEFAQRDLGYPALRLIDLELRYKDDLSRPVVKKLAMRRQPTKVHRSFGGTTWRSAREAKRGAKQNARRNAKNNTVWTGDPGDIGADVGIDGGVVTDDVFNDKSFSIVEVTFLNEEAQGVYEMELWGAIYPPDMRKAVAGRYVGAAKFEIEAMR